MTDKEFKRLKRSQLIEVIYQLQLHVDSLTEKNRALEDALEDRRLRIRNAGDIAQAALVINDCFKNAQSAAEQYLNEIKALREEIETERREVLEQAEKEAAMIIDSAKKEVWQFCLGEESNLNENGKNDSK